MRFQPDVIRRYADAVAMERELADIFGRQVDLIDYRAVVDWSEKLHSAQGNTGVGGGDLCGVKKLLARECAGVHSQGSDGCIL